MTHHEVHRMIGRALTDREFRHALLDAPPRAAGEFPLTSQERDLIASIEAASLEDFALELSERLEASENGSASPNRKLRRNGHGP